MQTLIFDLMKSFDHQVLILRGFHFHQYFEVKCPQESVNTSQDCSSIQVH